MNIYILGIIIFLFIIVLCVFFLLYYKNDERKLKEITTEDLKKLGKVYTQEEFEDQMFQLYANIISNIAYEDYSFLKDSVSDDMYNQILLSAKKNHDNQEHQTIKNINKQFSRLIQMERTKDLEIAKLWVRYSDIEYKMGMRKTVDEEGREILQEMVVEGDQNHSVMHEYILTFVKNRTQNENIVCPNCGYQTHILTSSHCIRCEAEIVPKKMHWVFVEKVSTNISNKK